MPKHARRRKQKKKSKNKKRTTEIKQKNRDIFQCCDDKITVKKLN